MYSVAHPYYSYITQYWLHTWYITYGTQLIRSVCTLHWFCFMLSTATRFQNVAVDVSPLNSVSPTPCAKIHGVLKSGSMTSVKCSPGSEGRYVTILFTGKQRVLSVAQVLVYGESGMLVRQFYWGTTSAYWMASKTMWPIQKLDPTLHISNVVT